LLRAPKRETDKYGGVLQEFYGLLRNYLPTAVPQPQKGQGGASRGGYAAIRLSQSAQGARSIKADACLSGAGNDFANQRQ
jgi:hypothetical protein